MPPRRVPIYLHASDPISHAGVAGQLRPRPEIQVLGQEEADRATVAVVVADSVSEDTRRLLRGLRCGGVPHLVVVATEIGDADLVAMVEVGVAGLIRRCEATPDRLVSVIVSAAEGEGSVP